MHKRIVDWSDYANTIVKANPKGVLFTTKSNDKVNTMTIGWGTIGTNWTYPVFCAYIRQHRYTAEMLDANPFFTINVPLESSDRSPLGLCGSVRGDEIDKIAEAGLTLVDPETIDVPGIAEFPLTLECRVIYKQLQDPSAYPPEFASLYPQDIDSMATGVNKDPHIAVFGEITCAYLIEP